MNTFEFVVYSKKDTVGTIMLNRPDKLNAFAGRMRQDLSEAVRLASDDEDVRVIVITGAGRAFCAGADIGYMKELTASDDHEAFGLLVEAGRDVVTTLRQTPKPVVASINGPAAGGGANLALACDFRIASEKASIGQTFNKIGLHPDWGGTYLLPRLVGPAKAIELMFSGDMITADEALKLGIFNKVVPHEQLSDETALVAQTLASKPPMALALIKRAVYSSDAHSLSEMLDIELEHQLRCFKSRDAKEGLAAFLEKRAPTFVGR